MTVYPTVLFRPRKDAPDRAYLENMLGVISRRRGSYSSKAIPVGGVFCMLESSSWTSILGTISREKSSLWVFGSFKLGLHRRTIWCIFFVMLWVFYIGGKLSKGKLVTIKIGVSGDPLAHLAALSPTQPYDLTLLGVEVGDLDLLEKRQSVFKSAALCNGWYRPVPALLESITRLPKLDLGAGASRRVCLDLSPEEFTELEAGVETIGTVTKTRLIRRALSFYLRLGKLRAKGYILHAMKGGKFTAFPDLDDIRDPE